MKSLRSLSLAILALSTFGLSMAHSRSIDPNPKVISVYTGGGMPGPNGSFAHETVLFNNGKVVSIDYVYPRMGGAPKITSKIVLTIDNPTTMRTIRGLAARISSESNELEEQKQMGCMDAPSTTYYVERGPQKLKIKTIQNCIPLNLKNPVQREIADQVVKYLESFSRLR